MRTTTKKNWFDEQAYKLRTDGMCLHINCFFPLFSWKAAYRTIPRICPSMYKPLQIKAPQTGNAKNPPLNRLFKYKPSPPLPPWKIALKYKVQHSENMVKYKPRGLFSEFYGISAKASDVSTKPNSSEKPVKGSVRVS